MLVETENVLLAVVMRLFAIFSRGYKNSQRPQTEGKYFSSTDRQKR